MATHCRLEWNTRGNRDCLESRLHPLYRCWHIVVDFIINHLVQLVISVCLHGCMLHDKLRSLFQAPPPSRIKIHWISDPFVFVRTETCFSLKLLNATWMQLTSIEQTDDTRLGDLL